MGDFASHSGKDSALSLGREFFIMQGLIITLVPQNPEPQAVCPEVLLDSVTEVGAGVPLTLGEKEDNSESKLP